MSPTPSFLANSAAWPGAHPRRAAMLLALLCVLAYLPALRNEFVWDDLTTIVLNDRLRAWSAIPAVFFQPAVFFANQSVGVLGTYRPLALLSFVLDYQLYGSHAWGFHLTSMVLHALCSVAVFVFFSRVFSLFRAGLEKTAFWAALLFALHPAHVEAVAWVNGRSEPFATLFGVLALCSVAAPTFSLRHSVAIGFSLLFALFGKETGVVFLPAAVFLSLLIARNEQRYTRLAHTTIATILAAGLYLFLRRRALGTATAPPTTELHTLLLYIPAVWTRMLQEIFFPVHHGIGVMGAWLREQSSLSQVFFAGIFLSILFLAVHFLRRRNGLGLLGLGWWITSLMPVIFLINTDWPGLNRWIYVGSPGFLLALWTLLPEAKPQLAKLYVVVVLFYVVLLQQAIFVWRNELTLYEQSIAEQPTASFGHMQYGFALTNASRWQEALLALQRARQLGTPLFLIEDSRALALTALGRCDKGIPLYYRARHYRVAPLQFASFAGRCYRNQGRLNEAIEQFRLCASVRRRCRELLEETERQRNALHP